MRAFSFAPNTPGRGPRRPPGSSRHHTAGQLVTGTGRDNGRRAGEQLYGGAVVGDVLANCAGFEASPGGDRTPGASPGRSRTSGNSSRCGWIGRGSSRSFHQPLVAGRQGAPTPSVLLPRLLRPAMTNVVLNPVTAPRRHIDDQVERGGSAGCPPGRAAPRPATASCSPHCGPVSRTRLRGRSPIPVDQGEAVVTVLTQAADEPSIGNGDSILWWAPSRRNRRAEREYSAAAPWFGPA